MKPDIRIGDHVQSRGFLNAFPRQGVVTDLFSEAGFNFAIYEDENGDRWKAHADQLTKIERSAANETT